MLSLRRNFLFAWSLRTILSIVVTMGWIACVTFTLTGFSLHTLPLLFLLQAVFTIIGMLFFSTIIERFPIKQLLAIALAGALVSISLLFLTPLNHKIHLVIMLISTGLFLPQIELLFSHLLEYHFTPQQALKTFPWLESAEMTGGVIGGLLAAGLGLAFQDLKIVWFVCFLLGVVFGYMLTRFSQPKHAVVFLHDQTPLEEKNLNAFVKAVKNIQKTPLLQVLLFCIGFNALLFHLLEFQYAQAIYDQVFHASPGHSPVEGLLKAFGLFSFGIYGLTLILQCCLAGGLLKKIGIQGGFLVHALTTLLSSIGLFLTPGNIGVLLARNNFEITTALRKNSYEMSYYGFKEGTQRSLRELYEAFITPCMTIFATSLMIILQWLLLPNHVSVILRICILFAAFGMCFFSFQLHFSKKIS